MTFFNPLSKSGNPQKPLIIELRRVLTCKENVLQEFVVNVIGNKNNDTSQNSSGSK